MLQFLAKNTANCTWPNWNWPMQTPPPPQKKKTHYGDFLNLIM
jgi:hypothetical protein